MRQAAAKKDNNKGGSYRESYGDGSDKKEDNYTYEKGGWESDRSGNERKGYGRKRNYKGHITKTKQTNKP